MQKKQDSLRRFTAWGLYAALGRRMNLALFAWGQSSFVSREQAPRLPDALTSIQGDTPAKQN